jgi:hypothetical protein
MTTPEETRDRIKKMRDRIFKESDEVPLENDSDETTQGSDKEPAIDPIENNVGETLQEKESTSEKTKIVQKDEISSKTATPTNLQEKLKQNDDKLSLLGADTQKKISEIAQEFKNKSSILETTILDKIEHTFADSNDKIGEIEHLVNENALSLSQANTALKKEINEINGSIQLDINSVTKRFSTANQEIEKELQNIGTVLHNSTDKLSQFENSVEERQNSLEENLYEKLQQNSYKLSLLSGETHNQITEITQDFESKSSILETTMLDKLEDTFADSNTKIDRIEHLLNNNSISSSQANKALKERLDELNRSLQLDINSVTKRFSSEDQNIRAELQNSTDKLLKFENSVDERQNSLEESFYEKLQQNGDKLSLLSADTQRQISEIAQEFAIKSSSLETVMLDKLEHTFAESNDKIGRVEQLVNDNILISFQANKALKERLEELNRSLRLDINSVTKRFSSADQKIEKKLQTNVDKLSKFESFVEERQNSLEESFFEKLQENKDKLSSLSADTQKQISEITQEFASKSSSLETTMLDKIEHISFHLKKVEEQIENRISDFSASLQKYVSSITASQEDKIDAQAKKIQDSVKSLKQEIFDNQRDLQADFYKKIKAGEIKTNDYLSERIVEVRELLSGEIESLSEELANLNDVVKEKHSELAKHVDNNVSTITRTAEKDRKSFYNRFEEVTDNIQLVEAKIVKEEELTELFQNYTLNINISDND